jgi:hypothetical protein
MAMMMLPSLVPAALASARGPGPQARRLDRGLPCGSLRRRGRDPGRGLLPAHRGEDQAPATVPDPAEPGGRGAAGSPRRPAGRGMARRGLHRLLHRADGGSVRARAVISAASATIPREAQHPDPASVATRPIVSDSSRGCKPRQSRDRGPSAWGAAGHARSRTMLGVHRDRPDGRAGTIAFVAEESPRSPALSGRFLVAVPASMHARYELRFAGPGPEKDRTEIRGRFGAFAGGRPRIRLRVGLGWVGVLAAACRWCWRDLRCRWRLGGGRVGPSRLRPGVVGRASRR